MDRRTDGTFEKDKAGDVNEVTTKVIGPKDKTTYRGIDEAAMKSNIKKRAVIIATSGCSTGVHPLPSPKTT